MFKVFKTELEDQKEVFIRAQTESADAVIKTFQGQDYLVVPVIAMVEGVRFGVTQKSPELGLASEFGRVIAAWNNRPLVINHPFVDGDYVSANSVDVLEDWSFGFTNNAQVKNKKLKLDAWINLARGEEDENVQYFIDAVNAGEILEVSVGIFLELEESIGVFQGKEYAGIWRNIVPDHLAFLTDTTGACSIEDGCGTSRVNQGKTQEKNMFRKLRGDNSAHADECNCNCNGTCNKCSTDEVTNNSATTGSALKAPDDIVVHTISSDIVDHSVYNLLSESVRKEFEEAWLTSYTNGDGSTAVFSQWTSDGYATKGVKFDLSSDGKVTFKGEPFDVRIVAHLYSDDTLPQPQEKTMSKEPVSQGSNVDNATNASSEATPVNPSDIKAVTPVVVQSAQDLVPAPAPMEVKETLKVMSRDEAINAMSAEDQKTVKAALEIQAQNKSKAIKALQDSGRCSFDDSYLQAQSLDTLNGMLKLADVSDYSGRVAPVEPATAPSVQSEDDANGYVSAPPSIFEKKQAAQ